MRGARSKSGFYLSLLPAIFLTAFGLSSFKPEASTVGKTITNFSLRNVDNKTISLADYRDAKGFIVVFTCNHCPFAKLYSARLNAMSKKYKALRVPLLAINSMDTVVYADESFQKMQQRASTEKFTFPYLHDAKQLVGRDFKAEHTPQSYVVWKEDKVWKIKYSGAIDDNGAEPGKVKNAYVANAVDELLQGKKLSAPETTSFGCAIFFRKQL